MSRRIGMDTICCTMDGDRQQVRLGDAGLEWDGERLTVYQGAFRREWRVTARGLATARLEHDGARWVDRSPTDADCDWYIFQLLEPGQRGEPTDVSLRAVEAPPLTAPHVLAELTFRYAEVETEVRYAVQAFAGAAGVRTQLSVRALRPFESEEVPSHLLASCAEALPLAPAACRRRAIGYYNDPQHRNHDDTPILRCEQRAGELAEGRREVYDWASILDLEQNAHGLLLVKESPKCVNQAGIDTGSFVLKPGAVLVTGLGLKANDYYGPGDLWLPHDRFRACWATWCVPYGGGEAELQLALKRFDRARFQPHPERMVYSRSNTWGTRCPGADARGAANQADVLKEIASCADLAIDAVAIDDGWQVPLAGRDGSPHDWRPHPERFPDGWQTVREAAARAGVELQLWLPGAQVTLEQIVRNIEQGGFTGLKVDFLNFPARDHLDAVLDRIERACRHTGYTLTISWDVTENASRLGYYFGREYGSLHTSNRKPTYAQPRTRHIAYTPRLVLRDAWHLAHYLNLNQVEIPVQDVSTVDPAVRNASAYSHGYCTAMAVCGLPLFFQETHFLAEGARDETRAVMQAWRRHREAMARGYVFPIGDEPCDEAWTGFQVHDLETGGGYVLAFRELRAPATGTFSVHFLDGRAVCWQDVLSGETWRSEDGGALDCAIPDAPGFRWLRYQHTACPI